MGLDIRRPIGLLFVLLGLLLVGYGLTGDRSVYQRSLGYNVNVGWGFCLLVFGLVCLALAWRGARNRPVGAVVEVTPEPPGEARRARPGGHM